MEWLVLKQDDGMGGVGGYFFLAVVVISYLLHVLKADHLLALLLPSLPCIAFLVEHGHSSVVSRTGDKIYCH